MPTDRYSSFADTPINYARRAVNVTPSGSDVALEEVPKAMFIASDGLVEVVPLDNGDADVVSWTATAAELVPFRVRTVKSTTAATVWALYD